MAKQKTVYLDNNATTPVHPEAMKAMVEFSRRFYGNSSSLHSQGRKSRAAIEEGRSAIGDFIGTEAVDIIFTSGGTESDNLAIKGFCLNNRDKGGHIITSSIEHLAVLKTCRHMEAEGFEVTYLDVDKDGLVNPADIERAITDKTILVSVMHANNEVGAIQPISEISKIIRRCNARRICFHTDAVQSLGKIPVDVEELGVDLLSISAHKIYGPKGIGALYIRKGIKIAPQIHGGHQESGLRAGTENIMAIVGFARAIELAKKNFRMNSKIKKLRDRLYYGLLKQKTGIRLNSSLDKTLPNTLNISFADVDSEPLLINLDIKGICASGGSACTSGSNEKSHVLKAMRVDDATARGSIRFSLGFTNTDDDIDYCISQIPAIIKRLRSVPSLISKA